MTTDELAPLAFALQFLEVVIPRLPLSTYRLQFNRGFTFRDAREIVGYLNTLGISDCYASSYLKAVPGSPHGYDVADPTRLNPDVGTAEDYWAWMQALRACGMGHVLDIVPNHMGIAKSSNPWWIDVLENGPSSRFARFFDIEWRPVKDELADKVLIPILGDQYGAVLERQELQLAFDNGSFVVRYYDDALPIAPDTYSRIFADALEPWLAAHPGDASDELLIILAASENLPQRFTREPDQIALRAREKEVVKRRLAALVNGDGDVRALVEACIERMNGVTDRPRSFDRLDRLLNEQSYRLAHWRVASEEINYRRFFDINQLAALRMEDPDVFDEVHRFALDLARRGGPTGFRIDHVDGLYSPEDYLQRLQAALSTDAGRFYIVVEKILGVGERLPREWPVAGTTGYEFASVVNNLFIDRRNEPALDDIYARFVRDRERVTFEDLAYRSKKQVMHETMSGDINSLGHQLNRFSERNRHFRDFTLYNLISTLKEVIACFPVYRTYVSASVPVSDHDRRYIDEAIDCAKRRAPGVTTLVFDFIQRLLLHETAVTSSEEADDRARFVGKFQQITSPVAAKGIEDTALYSYNRLLSLNEVGTDPTQFGADPEAVHAWMAERQRDWPLALSATSTHDTKRGEDIRARLNVLSEIPGAWKTAVTKWRTLNRRYRSEFKGAFAPDANEEYFLYQTLVGAWPFEDGDDALARFRERIVGYMLKALREAKVHTSWLRPNEDYEAAVLRFVDAILDRRRSAPFLQAFVEFEARVAELGIYNSLSQLVIKMTAPGVPDFYQGTELWDLNLVDPDNRRAVDYDHRRRILDALRTCTTPGAECASELLDDRRDGRVKLFVVARGLDARAGLRSVFERGDYIALQAAGGRRDSLFGFARRAPVEGDALPGVAITCVPRLVASLQPHALEPPIGRAIWGDTRLELPDGSEFSRTFRNVFTGETIEPELADGRASLAAAALFERFPVALLVPTTRNHAFNPSAVQP